MSYGYGPPSSSEVVFLQAPGIYVSRSRVVLGSATYPVNGISSVQVCTVAKGSGLIIWGLLMCVTIVLSPIGILLVILYILEKDKFAVVIGAGGIPQRVFMTDRQQDAYTLVEAINNALACR